MNLRTVLLAALILWVALAAQAADPFYMRLLREGTDAYNRRDFVTAERQLRIACFGLLDEPELLADGLVRLGLAQGSAGNTPGFAETFQRLAEDEERFGGYSKASIPSDVRNAFQQLVLKLIPRSTLAERPAMARLMPGGEDHVAKLTPLPATPPAATAAPARAAVPSPSRAAIAATPTVLPAATTTPTPTAVPTRAPVPAPRGQSASTAPSLSAAPPAVEPVAPTGSLTSPPAFVPPLPPAAASPAARRTPTGAEQRELAAIQELVRKNRIGDALARARRLADAQTGLPEAQFAAAELAYRTLRWPEAVAYFRRGGDPGEARPLLLFYEAVSLYETGDVDGAATVLKRSLPKIQRTSYVESYIRKILGPGATTTRKP